MHGGFRWAFSVALVLGLAASGTAAAQGDALEVALGPRLPSVDAAPAPEAEADTQAHGHAWLRRLSHGDRSSGRFRARLELPLASAALLREGCDMDRTEVLLVLSRDQVEVARCTLVPRQVDLVDEELEFEVDLRESDGALDAKAGSCAPVGIPRLRDGDLASAFLLDEAETLVAQGVVTVGP